MRRLISAWAGTEGREAGRVDTKVRFGGALWERRERLVKVRRWVQGAVGSWERLRGGGGGGSSPTGFGLGGLWASLCQCSWIIRWSIRSVLRTGVVAVDSHRSASHDHSVLVLFAQNSPMARGLHFWRLWLGVSRPVILYGWMDVMRLVEDGRNDGSESQAVEITLLGG